MPPAIEITDLGKSYGTLRAVDGLSLEVAPGEVLALLGPNGAGKTTTVECLEGYRTPDRGRVRVLGLDPLRERDTLMPSLGVMLQSGGVWQAATPRRVLRLYARLYPRAADPGALLEQVGLGAVAGRAYRTLSGGEQQRLRLALALAGRPRVALLDEPAAGLDPHGRRRVWDLVRDLRDRGAAVLLATHLVDEAERLADRVAVIHHGRLVACDRPEALVGAGQRVLVRSPAAIDAQGLAGAVGASVVADGAGRWVVETGAEAIPAVAAWFAERGHPLTELSAASGLAAAFLRLTTDPPAAHPWPERSHDSTSATDPGAAPAPAAPAAPAAAPAAAAAAPAAHPWPERSNDSTSATDRGERGAIRRLVAHARMELWLLARNGENLLVALGIPVGLLAFLTLVDVLPTGGVPAVDFLLPRMVTVAVMGSALVALAIHTGFERGYLVLKRLGATPLRRRELVAAKALAVLATVAVQALALVGAAAAMGWPAEAAPGGGSAAAGLAALLLGAVAFAGLGLLLAGTVRATLVLALVNGLFVVLLLVSGLLFPLDVLPAGLAAAAAALPSTALAAALDAALSGTAPPARALAVLLAWAATAPALAAWRFRWE